jgi:hypothetical protein
MMSWRNISFPASLLVVLVWPRVIQRTLIVLININSTLLSGVCDICNPTISQWHTNCFPQDHNSVGNLCMGMMFAKQKYLYFCASYRAMIISHAGKK